LRAVILLPVECRVMEVKESGGYNYQVGKCNGKISNQPPLLYDD